MKFSRLVAGTVGLSLCFAIGPFGARAKEALKPRKIGVIVINTGSEFARALGQQRTGGRAKAALGGHHQERREQSCRRVRLSCPSFSLRVSTRSSPWRSMRR